MNRDQVLQAAVLSLILGAERNLAHAAQGSHRPLSEDYEALGIFGECKFASDFGLRVDRTLRLGGDDGIDFHTGLGTVDVKTARKPGNLIVETTKIERAADILVLCKFSGFTIEPELLGWEVRAALAAAPTRDFGYGVINHYIPAESLRPMKQLHDLMARANQPSDEMGRCHRHGDYAGLTCLLCEVETAVW